MGLFNNWQLLIIRLLCFLGWFSTFALAQQMGEVVEFHSLGVTFISNLAVFITCLGNLSVFVTALIRGRLDVEIGARDVLDILASPKLKPINGIKDGDGLTTCRKYGQTASTERVRLPEMGEFFRRLRQLPQKMGEFFRRLPQKMGEFFRQLRHRLAINIPCFRGEEDLPTAAEEGRLQTTSTVEIVLQTASVVILSNGKPNLSIREFMKSNAPIVDSILLRFRPLQDAINDREVVPPEVTVETCGCNSCNCIVFRTVEELTIMLALRMPGTLKLLSNSLCLLPCLTCLTNGCHGCNGDSLLRVEGPLPLEQADEEHRLRVSEPKVEGPFPLEQADEEYKWRERDSKVECEILDEVGAGFFRAGNPICICIPMNDARCDNWTELLVRSLRSKDAENRGVRVKASEAMEDYLAGGRGGAKEESVEYNILSYIVPRLIEIFINGILTICLGVDGFSSSLIARRAVRNYVVDSKGSSLAANAFLTKAVVKCGANNTRVCQVLTFRGNYLCIRYLSLLVGCVNLLSSIVWALLISFEGRADSFPPLSRARLDVIIAFISIAGVMDETTLIISSLRRSGGFFQALPVLIRTHLILPVLPSRFMSLIRRGSSDPMRRALSYPGLKMFDFVFIWVLYTELSYPIVISLVLRSGRREKHYGRWIYAVLQGLVWLKWAVGSYIINFEKSTEFMEKHPRTWGILVHSSAFMLNAVTAGVRVKWKLWPWKHHHLVPRKLGP